MQSLKEKLNNLIRQKGVVSYIEIKNLCESGKFGRYYKMSNVERRLRKSDSPEIESVYENGYIKYYKWRGKPIEYKVYRVVGATGETEKIINIVV